MEGEKEREVLEEGEGRVEEGESVSWRSNASKEGRPGAHHKSKYYDPEASMMNDGSGVDEEGVGDGDHQVAHHCSTRNARN